MTTKRPIIMIIISIKAVLGSHVFARLLAGVVDASIAVLFVIACRALMMLEGPMAL